MPVIKNVSTSILMLSDISSVSIGLAPGGEFTVTETAFNESQQLRFSIDAGMIVVLSTASANPAQDIITLNELDSKLESTINEHVSESDPHVQYVELTVAEPITGAKIFDTTSAASPTVIKDGTPGVARGVLIIDGNGKGEEDSLIRWVDFEGTPRDLMWANGVLLPRYIGNSANHVFSFYVDEVATGFSMTGNVISGLGTPADPDHADTLGARNAAISAHAAAADPHSVYQKESEKSVANGYASLDATTRVPTVELATGTPDGTKFLRDDRTWVTPAGGGSTPDYILIRHVEPSDTNAGDFYVAGGWNIRPLNTEVQDAGGHASVGSAYVGTGLGFTTLGGEGDQVYTPVASTGGSGAGATWTVTRNGDGDIISVVSVSTGNGAYMNGDGITILGTAIGGATPADDLTFTLQVVGRITLAAGTYEIAACAAIAGTVARHRLRWRNITDSITAAEGVGQYDNVGSDNAAPAVFHGKFAIAGPKIFELQHWIQVAPVTGYAMGVATGTGDDEIFAWVELKKVA